MSFFVCDIVQQVSLEAEIIFRERDHTISEGIAESKVARRKIGAESKMRVGTVEKR